MPGLSQHEHPNGHSNQKAFRVLNLLGFSTLSETPEPSANVLAFRTKQSGMSSDLGLRYDNRLIEAVKGYQSSKSLPVTGHIDPATVDALVRDMKLRFEEVDSRAVDSTKSAFKFLVSMYDGLVMDSSDFASYGDILVKADGTGDHTTIAAAISAAVTGDTILLGDSSFNGEDFDLSGKVLHFRGVDRKTTISSTTFTKPAFKNVGAGSSFWRIVFSRHEQSSGTSGTLITNGTNEHLSIRECTFVNCRSIIESVGSSTSSLPTVLDRVIVTGSKSTAIEVQTNGYAEITNCEFQVDSSFAGTVLNLGSGLSSGSRIHVHHTSVVTGAAGSIGIKGSATVTNSVVDVSSSAGAGSLGIQAASVNGSFASSNFTTPIDSTSGRGNSTTSTIGFSNRGDTPLTLSATSPAVDSTTSPRFKSSGTEVPGANRCHFDLTGNKRERFRRVSGGASETTSGGGGFFFSP